MAGLYSQPVHRQIRNLGVCAVTRAEGFMKNKSNFSSFGSSSRRRSNLPIVPVAIVILLVLFIAFLWSRGGEQQQARVEKTIPAEQLGK